jgi:hypothetical protein
MGDKQHLYSTPLVSTQEKKLSKVVFPGAWRNSVSAWHISDATLHWQTVISHSQPRPRVLTLPTTPKTETRVWREKKTYLLSANRSLNSSQVNADSIQPKTMSLRKRKRNPHRHISGCMVIERKMSQKSTQITNHKESGNLHKENPSPP